MEAVPTNVSSLVVIVNSALAGLVLVVFGAWLAHGRLSASAPSRRQNIGESVLGFFFDKAEGMAQGPQHDKTVRLVMPFLASFFLFIIVCNLFGMAPLPIINRPPTSSYSVTLTLATLSVLGTLVIGARVRGVGKTAKHLVWPNPLQWVSEFTDILSLSLRLFGNIAGEYMTLLLVVIAAPVGIPLVLHALSVIPAFVQALVFTLLTASFLASAIHHEEKKKAEKTDSAPAVEAPIGTVATEEV